MKQYKSIVCLALLLSILFGCQKPQRESSFELNGKSNLTIRNGSKDSIRISLSNWIYLPGSEEKIDTILPANQTLKLVITTQARHYYNLKVQNKEFRLFAEPGVMNEMHITANKRQVNFAGELFEINEFLKSRRVDSDWQPRGEWYQGRGSVSDLVTAFDSITDRQKKEVMTAANLPVWYKEFEDTRLDYINAWSKLNALSYRKKLLSLNDSVPLDYVNQVTKDLPIERADLTGVIDYMRFLSDYLIGKTDSLFLTPIPGTMAEWVSYDKKYIQSIERNLSNEEIKDVLLAANFTNMIDRSRFRWNDDYLNYIHQSELLMLVEQQLLIKQILAPGEKLPYFYLSDVDSAFYEPDSFKGKIVLINFWATWCKPCYLEFEHENQLVVKFKNDPVEIVNICIESRRDKWEEVIHKYGLKTTNLFATQQWSEKINEYFGTSALPHSVLVDHNGNVIQNNCAGPGARVDELIAKALHEIN